MLGELTESNLSLKLQLMQEVMGLTGPIFSFVRFHSMNKVFFFLQKVNTCWVSSLTVNFRFQIYLFSFFLLLKIKATSKQHMIKLKYLYN